MERGLKRSDEKGRAQEVAPIQLPASQETASAPTPLWDVASVSTFRVQSTSPKPPWRSSLAKPPRSPYNGQSTPDARRRIPERVLPLGARKPSAPASRAALAYRSAPTATGSCSETAGGRRRRESSERGLCSGATRRADAPVDRAAERLTAPRQQQCGEPRGSRDLRSRSGRCPVKLRPAPGNSPRPSAAQTDLSRTFEAPPAPC